MLALEINTKDDIATILNVTQPLSTEQIVTGFTDEGDTWYQKGDYTLVLLPNEIQLFSDMELLVSADSLTEIMKLFPYGK